MDLGFNKKSTDTTRGWIILTGHNAILMRGTTLIEAFRNLCKQLAAYSDTFVIDFGAHINVAEIKPETLQTLETDVFLKEAGYPVVDIAAVAPAANHGRALN